MHTPEFRDEDFQVFHVEGLEPRMEALKRRIRPKLEMIGTELSPALSAIMGEPVTFHVAKHARRTVHPPEETWVAWSVSKRGYKALPHFQFGLRDTHLFAWFALIYECPDKAEFARRLQARLKEIWTRIPDDFMISKDHTVPEATVKRDLSEEEMLKLLDRLERVKKAEFLCGTFIPREEAVHLTKEQLIFRVESAFRKLEPLYRLAVLEPARR
ncbi:YktB family protein [Staphylospora marina]|uniref:YktB family protein n=1 Tax=Staphylospora marina TaxID=2490858 RepID=UPI002406665F|nr:DUF1054 domain-containing protein [Staphylospora marina]